MMTNLRFEIVQQGKNTYFWLLMSGKEQIARSCKIEPKDVIEKEVDELSDTLFDLHHPLPVIINER